MKKVIVCTWLLCFVIAGIFAVNYQVVLAQSTPAVVGAKTAIVGKMLIPSATTYTTLTSLCGRTSAFLFKGYVAFDPANTGTANYLKPTITYALPATATAGSAATFSAVNSDTVQIKGTITDYVTIVGEDVEPLRPNG